MKSVNSGEQQKLAAWNVVLSYKQKPRKESYKLFLRFSRVSLAPIYVKNFLFTSKFFWGMSYKECNPRNFVNASSLHQFQNFGIAGFLFDYATNLIAFHFGANFICCLFSIFSLLSSFKKYGSPNSMHFKASWYAVGISRKIWNSCFCIRQSLNKYLPCKQCFE